MPPPPRAPRRELAREGGVREQGQGGSGPSGSLLFAAVNNYIYVDLESAAPAHELRRAW